MTPIAEHLIEMGRAGLMPSTIEKRRQLLERVQVDSGQVLEAMTADDLRGWLDYVDVGPRTRAAYMSHLASFYRWAAGAGYVPVSPTAGLTRPRVRKSLPRPLTREQIARLVARATDADVRAMIVLGAYAGLRCMEMAGLDASDLVTDHDPAFLEIRHGKGDRPRVVPVGVEVVGALAHIEAGPVFRRDGARLSAWQVSHRIKRHMIACQVDGSAHQLRHTYATEFYARRPDLLLLQRLLGHASSVTTAGYAERDVMAAADTIDRLYT
jgi:integrase